MYSSQFSFKLECTPEQVSAKAFGKAAKAFAQMLDVAKASDWQMADVRLASIDFMAKPLVEDDNSAESAEILDRITGLASQNRHSANDVEDFRGLIKQIIDIVTDTDATLKLGMRKHEESFSPEVVSDLDSELKAITIKSARRPFGRVTGIIDKIVLQTTHRSIGLIDRITGQRIEVHFNKPLDTKVKNLTPGTEVGVKGFVCSPEGLGKPSEIDAEDITPVEKRHHPMVTAEDLEGVMAMELPEGVDSVSISETLGMERLRRSKTNDSDGIDIIAQEPPERPMTLPIDLK